MTDSIQFRRDHPFVNWAGVIKRREAEKQREESRLRHIEWERERNERVDRRTEWESRRTDRLHCDVETARKVMLHKNCGDPRFVSPCCGCGRDVTDGTLYKVDLVGGGSRWMVVCTLCQAAAT